MGQQWNCLLLFPPRLEANIISLENNVWNFSCFQVMWICAKSHIMLYGILWKSCCFRFCLNGNNIKCGSCFAKLIIVVYCSNLFLLAQKYISISQGISTKIVSIYFANHRNISNLPRPRGDCGGRKLEILASSHSHTHTQQPINISSTVTWSKCAACRFLF